jgi:hypothetical protein
MLLSLKALIRLILICFIVFSAVVFILFCGVACIIKLIYKSCAYAK